MGTGPFSSITLKATWDYFGQSSFLDYKLFLNFNIICRRSQKKLHSNEE